MQLICSLKGDLEHNAHGNEGIQAEGMTVDDMHNNIG